jgi:hypothetical protein
MEKGGVKYKVAPLVFGKHPTSSPRKYTDTSHLVITQRDWKHLNMTFDNLEADTNIADGADIAEIDLGDIDCFLLSELTSL